MSGSFPVSTDATRPSEPISVRTDYNNTLSEPFSMSTDSGQIDRTLRNPKNRLSARATDCVAFHVVLRCSIGM